MIREYHPVVAPNAVEKTRLLETRIMEGATDPKVRAVALGLVRGLERGDHLGRLERIHRYVRTSIDYHREPVEMFQRARVTLEEGGDCDCLVILLCALAWSLRYPWAAPPIGDLDDPEHYTAVLGWPPSDNPHGDADTRWVDTEASCQAMFGEPSQAAGARRAAL